MSVLERNAVIAVLSTSQWGASKADKELASTLTAQYDAEDGTASVRKQLIPRDRLKALSGAIQLAKKMHHTMTLPYGDHGDRILPIGQLETYKTTMHAAIESVNVCRKDFIEAYDDGLAEDSLRALGRMGDWADYPTSEELKEKFGVSYEILPVPSAEHFVADVGEEERERIKIELEKRSEVKLNAAMVSIYERIESELRHLITRLGVDETGTPNRLHATALEAIKSLATAVPNLNITRDPKLNEIGSRISEALRTIEIDDLRLRTKKPEVMQHVTETREGLTKELTSIAEAYFGPEIKVAAMDAEGTGA